MSGIGWGGPARDHRKKTLVFAYESPKMQRAGVAQDKLSPQAQLVTAVMGGFSSGPPNRV